MSKTEPAALGLILKVQGDDSIPLMDLWETYAATLGKKGNTPDRAHAFFSGAHAALLALEKAGILDKRAVQRGVTLGHAQQLAANCVTWTQDPEARGVPSRKLS